MGEFYIESSGDEKLQEASDAELVESRRVPALNPEFRTYLGGKTAYGKPYSKGLVLTAIAEFLWNRGGSASLVKLKAGRGTVITTTQVEAIAGRITNMISTEDFRAAAKIKDIDELERQQLEMVNQAIQGRMASLEREVADTPDEDEEGKSLLQYELELIKKLVN
jgi:hypothetical protein